MLTGLALALALLLPGQTPDDSVRTAWADLTANVPESRWRVTRYLTLAAVLPDFRADYIRVLAYQLNSTSWRSVLAVPVVIADAGGVPQLIRIDLESLEWDYGARSIRLRELERRGVDFGLKDARDRADITNPWERFARDDPYFFANYEQGGTIHRGWIDPILEAKARAATYSIKFVLRADWLLSRLMLERDKFNGYYSLLLMLPPKEVDLYKCLAIDIGIVDRAENKLRHGGAVLDSIVALNNRELQLIPNAYGMPFGYTWRTLDVNVDARGNKSVLEALAGTLKHDGREIIFTLPSGLLGYYLANGDGVQVAVVPEEIAQVKAPLVPVKETRVVNAYKCIECHQQGIRSFEDVVNKGIIEQTIALGVNRYDAKQKAEASSLKAALEDYYRSPLGSTIQIQQAAYATRLFEACGMTGPQIATASVGYVESYRYDLVDPEQAARDMGFPLEVARGYWRTAVDEQFYAENSQKVYAAFLPTVKVDPYREIVGDLNRSRQSGGQKLPADVNFRIRANPILAILSSGQPIKRAAWEASFADAMRAVEFAWDKPIKAPAPKPKVQVKPR